MPTVVIAAGGTAGHVVPALAVADALRERGIEVEFIGGERAEAELVPGRGLSAAHAAGERASTAATWCAPPRRWCWPDGRRCAHAGCCAAAGADAVLGGGGYVAGPVGLAARTLGLPLVLSEADSHLGVTNRLLAPLARRVCLAFPLPGRTGPRYLVTGRPVPAGTGRAGRDAARERLGIPAGGPCLLVFGGSLGARRLNDAALEAFGSGAPAAVLHASGRRDYEDLRRRLDGARLPSSLPPVPVHHAVRRRARGR